MSGDQAMGDLWSDWVLHWSHRMRDRHCCGDSCWVQVLCSQTEYPFSVSHIICNLLI